MQTFFGVDPGWLLSGDPTRAIVNTEGERYTALDAFDAQLKFRRLISENMQLCVAYTLLRRVLKATFTREDRFGFVHRLEQFVRQALDAHPEYRKQVFNELQRNKKSSPQTESSSPSILVPTNAKEFELAANEMRRASDTFKAHAERGQKVIKKRLKNVARSRGGFSAREARCSLQDVKNGCLAWIRTMTK